MNTSPSTEERLWAVLSHLSALTFGMGILLPVLGWSEQRWKSKYASFQCLQALGYQSLGYTIWILSYLLIMIFLTIIFAFALSTMEPTGAQNDTIARKWAMIFVSTIITLFAIYLLLPVIAAIACARGKNFHYPILGNRLAGYLDYQQANGTEWLAEEHEERWVTAMGHFSVILVLWGLAAPFAVWITQGKRNAFLKFQSIQTLVYQAITTILYFVAIFIVLVGVSALSLTGGFDNRTGSNSALGIGLFIVFSLIGTVILLVIPLFHILGQWAGYRVLKGEDYHYPVIGRIVERWIAKNS